MSSELDYKVIREQVEVRVRKEKRLAKFILLATNLGVFVLFMVLGWQMYLSAGGTPPQWQDFTSIPGVARSANPFTSAMVMLTLGWVVALIVQIIALIIDSPIGERSIRDRAMGREMRREMNRLGLDSVEEHEKRKGMMRLTDDGELEEIADNAEAAVEPIQQNRKA